MASPVNEPTPWARYFPVGADTEKTSAGDAARYFFNHEARRNLSRMLDDVGPVDVAHLHIYHGKQTPAILQTLKARGIPIIHSLHEYKLACPVYTMQRNGSACEKCVTGTRLNCIRHRCKDGSYLRSAVMAAEFYTSRLLGDVRLVDRFLCVSDFQRRVMAGAGISDDKLFTLHNFVDIPSTDLLSGHDDYLLYFGRLEILKGLATLIKAAARTGRRLLIAGDGSWRPEMERQIRNLPNVEYLGFCAGPELTQLTCRAKAVVVPSQWYENCPMSVLEAMALGRPVIGARIGGIPELIENGRSGFLFEPGNIPDLIDAFTRLDSADHPAMCRAARRRAESRFSAVRYQNVLLSHYNSIQPAKVNLRSQPA